MYYTLPYLIPNFLCDQHDTLTMWGVARLFQEVAGQHVDTVGLGFSRLIALGKAWVLCRTCYQVDRLPHEGEQIELRTWSRGDNGLYALRDYQLIDGHVGAAVSCSSYWAIIDCQSRRVIRLHDMMNALETHKELAIGRETLDRLRLTKELPAVEPLAHFPVKPSMLDHTGHVNNSEYIKWVFDNLPCPIQPPFMLSVEYLLETQPQEHVSVYVYPSPSSALFHIANDRSTSVLAKIDY